MQAKQTSFRLNRRSAAMVSRQRFTLVSQIRQLAEEMGHSQLSPWRRLRTWPTKVRGANSAQLGLSLPAKRNQLASSNNRRRRVNSCVPAVALGQDRGAQAKKYPRRPNFLW
ncbi:hypothetical protein GGI08_004256 [Coemansia sp. S2]|nr:hypothetical protein GGI08_004256 [Coemansia sp. S2]